jgi:hypothetical protein
LDAEEPRGVPDEADTNIGDALAWGVGRLRDAGPGRKVVVLLSDGEHNVHLPGALTPRQAGQIAANLSVPVYAIDAGPDLPGDAARQAGRNALEAVAALTGGRCFAAQDAGALLHACREIDRLEKGTVESFQYRRYVDAYPWLGLAAAGCLLASLALDLTWWLRVP